MPNHFHGVLFVVSHPGRGDPAWSPSSAEQRAPIDPTSRAGATAPEEGHPRRGAPTLGDIVGWFKTMTTNEYIRGVKQHGWPSFQGKVWQRNYYEHIIRNERELTQIRKYIASNPARWTIDPENPTAGTSGRGDPVWSPSSSASTAAIAPASVGGAAAEGHPRRGAPTNHMDRPETGNAVERPWDKH